MKRRTELTLGSLLALAVVGAGVISWGQLTGQINILGSMITSADVAPIAVPASAIQENLSVRNSNTQYSELFDTTDYLDTQTTTGSWNIDASEAQILPNFVTGIIQSKTFSQLTGIKIRAHLQVTESKLPGSSLYYALSGDGGKTWTPIVNGMDAVIQNAASKDWRWRAIMNKGVASLSPTISDLTITLSTQK